jgi:hypothetical protein
MSARSASNVGEPPSLQSSSPLFSSPPSSPFTSRSLTVGILPSPDSARLRPQVTRFDDEIPRHGEADTSVRRDWL